MSRGFTYGYSMGMPVSMVYGDAYVVDTRPRFATPLTLIVEDHHRDAKERLGAMLLQCDDEAKLRDQCHTIKRLVQESDGRAIYKNAEISLWEFVTTYCSEVVCVWCLLNDTVPSDYVGDWLISSHVTHARVIDVALQLYGDKLLRSGRIKWAMRHWARGSGSPSGESDCSLVKKAAAKYGRVLELGDMSPVEAHEWAEQWCDECAAVLLPYSDCVHCVSDANRLVMMLCSKNYIKPMKKYTLVRHVLESPHLSLSNALSILVTCADDQVETLCMLADAMDRFKDPGTDEFILKQIEEVNSRWSKQLSDTASRCLQWIPLTRRVRYSCVARVLRKGVADRLALETDGKVDASDAAVKDVIRCPLLLMRMDLGKFGTGNLNKVVRRFRSDNAEQVAMIRWLANDEGSMSHVFANTKLCTYLWKHKQCEWLAPLRRKLVSSIAMPLAIGMTHSPDSPLQLLDTNTMMNIFRFV